MWRWVLVQNLVQSRYKCDERSRWWLQLAWSTYCTSRWSRKDRLSQHVADMLRWDGRLLGRIPSSPSVNMWQIFNSYWHFAPTKTKTKSFLSYLSAHMQTIVQAYLHIVDRMTLILLCTLSTTFIVSEMTYNVSMGTLNPTILYY